jgi:hypothetical protein
VFDQALVALRVDEGVRDDVVGPVEFAWEEGVGEAGLRLLAGRRALFRGWGGGSLEIWVRGEKGEEDGWGQWLPL